MVERTQNQGRNAEGGSKGGRRDHQEENSQKGRNLERRILSPAGCGDRWGEGLDRRSQRPSPNFPFRGEDYFLKLILKTSSRSSMRAFQFTRSLTP